MSPRLRTSALRSIVLAAALLALALVGATAASARTARWQMGGNTAPLTLLPGKEGRVIVTATNIGDAPIDATKSPVTLTDKLPLSLEVLEVTGQAINKSAPIECGPAKLPSAEAPHCVYHGILPAYTAMRIVMRVRSPQTTVTLTNQASVSGGTSEEVALAGASIEHPIHIAEEATRFGVEKYAMKAEEESGSVDQQAGSHPFQLTTNVNLNENAFEEPALLPRNLDFGLPAGLIGNPSSTRTPAGETVKCTEKQFDTFIPQKMHQITGEQNECPAASAVGVAVVEVAEPIDFEKGPDVITVPVFNLQAAEGEPARLGFAAVKVPVVLETSVATGSDYHITVGVHNATQYGGVIKSTVIVWGTPGESVHNDARGWLCAGAGTTEAVCANQVKQEEAEQKEAGEGHIKPFLQMPTQCTSPLTAPMTAEAWKPFPVVSKETEFTTTLTGCDKLSVEPSIKTELGTANTSTPTGMTVTIKVPQTETPGTLVPSAIKSTAVTLPQGVVLNPGAANGLGTCSALQIGLLPGFEESKQLENDHFSPTASECGPASEELQESHFGEPTPSPEASPAKVGTVMIKSPDLEAPLYGSVYLASENTNPFEPPLVLYIVAYSKKMGVRVKLAGTVYPDPTTGQITSVFENTPQVPFEEFKLSFFSDHRQSLVSPQYCGTYTSSASFTPWSGKAPVPAGSSFEIKNGPGGSPCPGNGPLPFTPGFDAHSESAQAGAFTPFSLSVGVPDGHQYLTSLTAHLPAGMAAMLSSITPCPIALADVAQCPAGSQIGHSTTESGLGGEPYTLPGNVFLTTGFDGAPFGISVDTNAHAGPFNLGQIVANSTITVNRSTAAVTVNAVESRLIDAHGSNVIGTTPLPTMVKGVPVQLKAVNVTVDRPGFQFNPTNCDPKAVEATLGGAQGGVVNTGSRFQVGNCTSLPFSPGLAIRTDGPISRAYGINFVVNVTSSPGQANIMKTRLVIPAAMPSRQSTIKQACPEAVFNANPASCDEGSNVGYAIVHTPVLKSPLTGPAYLVSHGGAAFPDVEFVLQGEGIELILDGQTNIHLGVTTSTFNSVPDAPVSSFEAVLPAGPHSALAGYVGGENTTFCGTTQTVPTTITGQNGVVIERTTPVTLSKCSGVLPFKVETNAQKLAKALKQCRKLKKKSKRQACEKAARKKYGPKHKPKKKSAKKK